MTAVSQLCHLGSAVSPCSDLGTSMGTCSDDSPKSPGTSAVSLMQSPTGLVLLGTLICLLLDKPRSLSRNPTGPLLHPTP